MNSNIKRLLVLSISLLLSACTSLIDYRPTGAMSFKDANAILDASYGSHVDVNDQYIQWDRGDRVYFKSIVSVNLFKRKSWYYVYIFVNEGRDKYALWTVNLPEAQEYMEAMESLRLANAKKSQSNLQLDVSNDAKSADKKSNIENNLQKLMELKNDGVITDKEYEIKKQKLLKKL